MAMTTLYSIIMFNEYMDMWDDGEYRWFWKQNLIYDIHHPNQFEQFWFTRELTFNKYLKLLKHIEYIWLDSNRIKPNKFCMRNHKYNKITKIIRL